MNANPTASVAHRNIATNGSARRLARNAVKAPHARESRTIARSASARKVTLDRLSANVAPSATAMLTARDHDQLVTMESARILATVRAVSTLTATFAV